jgi:hypothetical protein
MIHAVLRAGILGSGLRGEFSNPCRGILEGAEKIGEEGVDFLAGFWMFRRGWFVTKFVIGCLAVFGQSE